MRYALVVFSRSVACLTDDTEDMPIPDYQYIPTTRGAKLGEEGRCRLMQKLDALLVRSNSNRQIDADVDIHWTMRDESSSLEFQRVDLRRGLIDHAYSAVILGNTEQVVNDFPVIESDVEIDSPRE